MSSVLQRWVMDMPIKMQSTLILGLRGFDGQETPNIKRISKWLRGITFVPGRMDNLYQFMGAAPGRIVEKDLTYNELDFVTRHYFSHIQHALEVVGYMCPNTVNRELAFGLYQDMCHFFHLPVEPLHEFKARLGDVIWPEGQPDNFEEAHAQLMRTKEPCSVPNCSCGGAR